MDILIQKFNPQKKRQYINALPPNFIDIKKNYFLIVFTVDCDPSLK